MAEFQKVMNEWRRMCDKMREYEYGCRDTACPLVGICQYPSTTDGESLEKIVMEWAEKNPELVYPTWMEFFITIGLAAKDGKGYRLLVGEFNKPMDADIAGKLGIEPKEAEHG